MIGWFGPAVLLVLLAAANLPAASGAQHTHVAAVLGEERASPVAPVDAVERTASAGACRPPAARPLRAPARWQSLRDYGLPAPRAPTRRR